MSKRFLAAILLAVALLPRGAFTQPVGEPRPSAVAETQLLMAGLAEPNFRVLGETLSEQPKDEEAWVYGRGQALLIAEMGNLLMLRPPRGEGRENWLRRSSELRTSGEKLARQLAGKQYLPSRAGLVNLANVCNRCHRDFRVAARVVPFGNSE